MQLNLHSAEEFLVPNPSSFIKEYVFPFTALDPTPGGQNLGRIMFNLELIPEDEEREGRYFYKSILLQVFQTRDDRYFGKTFEIPCLTEALNSSMWKQDAFVHHVWRIQQCTVHKAPCLSAYPKDHHKKLRITVGSSISVDAIFE